ncbi:MAG: 23S rRNA (guanosine(2251)-2'-O)-methyltransferase RlmB [Pseudomonadota bacterium]
MSRASKPPRRPSRTPKPPAARGRSDGREARRGERAAAGEGLQRPDGLEVIYGLHAAAAVLANPGRAVREVLATRAAGSRLADEAGVRFDARIAAPADLDGLCGAGAVHQGVAVLAEPLARLDLEAAAAPAEAGRPVLVLDQITDPRNIGAILRSAAAFAARCVVVHDRSTPPLDGALAKAAAGAVETVPVVRAVNIARAVEELQAMGYRAVGLAGETEAAIGETLDGPVAIALGAEGPGLRRLVRERCDALARIPMPGVMESLNVSVAAAIALYEASRRRPS